MEPDKRRTFSGREGVAGIGKATGRRAKAAGNTNEQRRKQYTSDPAYAEKVKKAARDYYRQANPLPSSKLRSGLLTVGVRREVEYNESDHPVTVDSYTIPEAALALGRTEACLKRWLRNGLIPSPVLRDTSRGYRVYSEGELSVIARELAVHEQEFVYLAQQHTVTINRLWQAMHGYRATKV